MDSEGEIELEKFMQIYGGSAVLSPLGTKLLIASYDYNNSGELDFSEIMLNKRRYLRDRGVNIFDVHKPDIDLEAKIDSLNQLFNLFLR